MKRNNILTKKRQMKTTTIFMTLLIAVTLILSSAVTATTTFENTNINAKVDDGNVPARSSTGAADGADDGSASNGVELSSEALLKPATAETRGVVIYDNDMSFYTGFASQEEISYVGEGAWIADDFSFTTPDGSDVCIDDVHWVGVYWNPAFPAGGTQWRIDFFEDDGTGFAPGDHYAGPFTIDWADITASGGPTFWTLGADIPQVCFPGCGEKMWISIYGYFDFPPQSGTGMHDVPIKGSMAMFRSTWFGYYPDWVSTAFMWGDPHDMAFQLTQKPEHDVGVIDIISPYDGQELCECLPVEVTVQNFGAFAETNVPVNVKMLEYFFADDLTGPYDGTAIWQQTGSMEWIPSPGPDNPGNVMPLSGPDMALLQSGSLGPGASELFIINPTDFDLANACNPKIIFNMWHDTYGSDDWLTVLVDQGMGWQTQGPQFKRVDCPGCPAGWVQHEVALPKVDNLIIGFGGASDSNTMAYNLHIDDVMIVDEHYDETVLIDIDVGETKDVILPDWCPCQWHILEYPATVTVEVTGCTQMVGDQIPANDCWTETATIGFPCFHDVAAKSIDEPIADPGCMEFDMCGTIKNVGQYEECCFSVYMSVYETIPVPDFAPPILLEDFEHGGAFPPGWTTKVYSGTGEWQIETYPTSYDPPGFGMYFAEADSDEHSTDVFDTGFFTPGMDLSCAYEVAVNYARNFQDYAGSGYMEVNTYSGTTDNYEETLFSKTTDDPYSGLWATHTFNPITYADPANVFIEFYYSTEGGTYAWKLSIDDVSVDILQTAAPFGAPEYEDDYCVDEIDVCEEMQICFDTWIPAEPFPDCGFKIYAIVLETRLCDPPECPTGWMNDKVIECMKIDFYHDVAIEITSPAKSAVPFYGYDTLPDAGEKDLVSFYPVDPVVFTEIDYASTLDLWGMTFVEDVWWAASYATSSLYTIDTGTGAMTLVGAAGAVIRDLAYDDSTGILYGTSLTDFYTIDMGTGAATHVGTYSSVTGMDGLACDGAGKLYGCDLWTDTLYDVNPGTGAETAIGPLGIDISFAQNIDYDKDNDIIYSSGYKGSANGGGFLGTLDPATGAYTFVGDLPTCWHGGGTEIALAIPYEMGIPEPDVWVPCGEQSLCVNVKNQGTFDEVDDPVSPCDCEGVVVYMELYKWIWDDPCVDPTYEFVLEAEQCVDINCEEEKEVCFGPYDFDTSGIYEIFFEALIDPVNSPPDDCFPDDNDASIIMGVDCCPPESSHLQNPEIPDGDNNWYLDEVTVKVTAIDPFCPDPCIGTNSGVKEIHYKINGDEEVKTGSSATFKVSDEGVNLVEYWAVDNAGNLGDVFTFEVAIDSVNPTVDPDYTLIEDDTKVQLRANPGDATSGIAKVEFEVDGSNIGTLTAAPWEITEDWQDSFNGATFKVTATDNAGNTASGTISLPTSVDINVQAVPVPVSGLAQALLG